MRPAAAAAPTLRLRAIVAGLVVACGCSVLLDPERLDDVLRCDFDDDCPEPDDMRYALVCRVSDEHPIEPDFPKICSPEPAVLCQPERHEFHSEFRTRWREATGIAGRYDDPCKGPIGVWGCPPGNEGCVEGLSPHPVTGRCDDDDESTQLAIAPQPFVAGQDVLDQFCRSIFCDETYVCNRRGDKCQPCIMGDGLGYGGCGELYPEGHSSSVYESAEQLAAQCLDDTIESLDQAQLGPITHHGSAGRSVD